MVAGCPVTSCSTCTFPGISFMDCPKWCEWAQEQNQLEADFNEMLSVVTEYDRLCDVCLYQVGGCNGGVMNGVFGPIYPPCADGDPIDYVDEDGLREVYGEIMEGY